MAKARRSSGSKKKSRGWLWMIAGLALGAALMWAAQHYLYRDIKPFSGIASLLQSGNKVPDPKPENKPQTESGRLPKPKLDFYTILPGESVLPAGRRDDKKIARTEPAEKTDAGVVYMLQAAAYANPEDADRLKANLVLNGLEARIEKITVGDQVTHYRVRLGPYRKIEDLDAAYSRLDQLGIKAMRLKVKKGTG